MGELFEKEGFSSSDGDIDNLLDPLNGWRMPSAREWEAILDEHVYIGLSGVSHAGKNNPYGLLVFPDGETTYGKGLYTGMEDSSLISILTLSELNQYLAQGCMFFPASGNYKNIEIDPFDYTGEYYGQGWETGDCLFYLSSTTHSPGKAYYTIFFFGDNPLPFDYTASGSEMYFPIRLVKPVE